jgi:surface antigen
MASPPAPDRARACGQAGLYQAANGTYCREYQQEITVGGKEQQSYGTACRQPDGTWKILNS